MVRQTNCTQFKDEKCLHQATPRRLLGSARCILYYTSDDPLVELGCRLQVAVPRQCNTQLQPPLI